MSYLIEKQQNGLLLFTIARDEKRNAINYDVMEGLSHAIKMAAESDALALVITGEGNRAFCSGGDLSVFHQLYTKEEAYQMLSKMSRILYSLLILPIPTVALLNGPAIGGGCELAIACDYRLAKKGVKAGFVQGNQAITTGWGGGTILSEKILPSNAMKLLMDAEPLQVEDLERIGFIDKVFENDPLEACAGFLEKLLLKDASVLQAYKRILIRKWEEQNLLKRIEDEVKTCAVLWESDAHHEYVNHFINKKH